MSLVSYVDILEVVGNLQDFRKRLIEGETIANESGIVGSDIIRIDKSGWEVLAKCKAQLDDDTIESLSVRICCSAKPRNLKCSCSCNHEISAKCKHVIATLIFLNRKNASAEIREAEAQCAESVDNRKSPSRKDHLKKPVTPTRQSQRSRKLKTDEAHVSIRNGNASARAGGRGPEHFKTVEPIKEQIKSEDDLTSNYQDGGEVDIQNDITCQEESSDIVKSLSDRKKNIGLRQKKSIKHSEPGKIGESQTSRTKRRRVQPNVPQRSSTLPAAECPSSEDFSEDSARSFPCDICGKSFERKASLANHLRHHLICKPPCKTCNNNKKPAPLPKEDEEGRDVPENCANESEQRVHPEEVNEHACQDCEKSFSSKRHLDVHVRVHEQDSDHRYTCEICGKTFRKKSQLTEHKRTHDKASRPQYQCTKCGKCYLSKRSFLAHANCDRVSKAPLPEGAKRRTIVNCQVCGKGFSNRMHHEEHMRSHTGERPFQCLECGKGFASKRSLRNHSHDDPAARERPFLCAQCPAKFATAFLLKTHSQTHTDEKPWVCSECGKGYRSQHVLIDHQNQHRGIKAHTCKECGKKFTWRTSLWAHSRHHARNKPFECVQCGATFGEQLELKEHWVEHSDDKPYQCTECGIGYLLEEARDKHMETHKKEPTHTCPVCNESFTRADMLFQHSQIHKEPRTCLCPLCGKTLKGHLRVHMMIHSGEKPFECETCQKRFYTRSLLRKHTVFHSSERPFECTMCGDRFPTQGILKAHIRIHKGEKPFTCKTCGKSFTQSTYLKRHMMTHSGERPYPCTVCDSAFTSRYDLKVHMRVHTGEKPFACDECSERFYERSTLTVHRRVHTGELPFKCDQCEKAFNTRNHFRKHFARTHPDMAPFVCETCAERFSLCEELRKHRKSVHLVCNSTEPPETTPVEASIVLPIAAPKDPLESLIQDSEILQDDPSLPEVEHSIGFHVPVVVDGSSIVDGAPIVGGDAIVDGQIIEVVPVTNESLPLNLETVDSVQVYEESNVEYGQILRSTLLR